MASGIVRKQGLPDELAERFGQQGEGDAAQPRLLRMMRNPPFYRACLRGVARRGFA